MRSWMSGFADEAFGVTRTLIDIFFTLRYIANQDTDNRAKLYWQFFAKDSELWKDYSDVDGAGPWALPFFHSSQEEG